ncbi:DUF3726 domain-containing protein [uncultured Erythrobacter sp.]|uniref:DUF3726 domain-containing protein n=1 Tax=uncultured Erythrobacter sp. TaxID=263913 RepID=UPI00261FF9D1|nr:DUF3726 domain-containing protein [uncultured Erythrobacter sp.]
MVLPGETAVRLMPEADVSRGPALSRNELLAFLRRVFEALLGKRCDYEAVAEQIVWLECHGLGGLDMLRACLTRLDLEEQNVESHLPGAFSVGGGAIDLDAGGGSLLCFGDLLTDMLIVQSAEQGSCRIEIADLREGQAVLPQLHRMALAGCFAAARVRNPQDGTSWSAHITAASRLPALSGCSGSSGCADAVSMSLICASSEPALRSAMHAFDPHWPEPTIASDQLAANYKRSLDSGIPVGDLSALAAIADRVLVEATEESRRGAGE